MMRVSQSRISVAGADPVESLEKLVPASGGQVTRRRLHNHVRVETIEPDRRSIRKIVEEVSKERLGGLDRAPDVHVPLLEQDEQLCRFPHLRPCVLDHRQSLSRGDR